MSHPLKSEASSAHNAKLRAMTTHYGLASGPANNITSPQERLKGEGGEHHVGFGADSDAKSAARGDRPARTSTPANPIATYARGGKVKHKDDGGSVSAIEAANKAEGEAEAAEKANGGVIARAKGGRAKHKGSTHVNVIVAPQGQGAGRPPPSMPSPQLAALAAGAHPPMGGPPPGPPGGPPMMPPPGAGGPPPGAPPMPMRARGGKVMGGHPNADDGATAATLREEGLVRKAKGGGITMKAGAVTGIGRLEKMGKNPPLHRGSMEPKEV